MLRATFGLLAAFLFGPVLWAEGSRRVPAPAYSASSIVNAASNQAGPIAPNTIVSLYGSDLAFVTRAIVPDDLHGQVLPTTLSGTGVRVLIGKQNANLYFISPTQINFLVPASLIAGPADVQVGIDGRFGPAVRINLSPVAPALFQADAQFAVGTRPDGSTITKDQPAHPGDIIVLYATGLGIADRNLPDGKLPPMAFPIERVAEFRVRIAGVLMDRSSVFYVGVTPGFAGLYQVNLKLPEDVAANPEIRIGFDDQMSPASVMF
ncbi:MAG: IPT/TIG domain-containing protein, partial [Bryobacteraceae bacterium]